MALRDIAQTDLAYILEGDEAGFRWPVTITNPDGVSNTDPLFGLSNDIADLIDPDTGQAVSGRLATVVLRIQRLLDESLGIPYGVSDPAIKPWVVMFNDINGISYQFKVRQANPDRTLGSITCYLEAWNTA